MKIIAIGIILMAAGCLNAADIELKVPYDNGNVFGNGQEYKVKLTDDIGFLSFVTNEVKADERLVVSSIGGAKLDDVEIVVRGKDGKRLYDWRQARAENAGIISVSGQVDGLWIYVSKTKGGDVAVKFLVSKLSKKQLEDINKTIVTDPAP